MKILRTLLSTLRSRIGIHALKVAMAFALGLFLMHIFNLKMGRWMIVSAAIVMAVSTSTGAILHKSYFRVIGTILGALFAAGVIYFFNGHPVIIGLSVIFVGFLFTWLANSFGDYETSSVLGIATFVLVVMQDTPTVYFVAVRAGEVLLGILVAFIVSRFVLPLSSERAFRESFQENIKNLTDFYELKLLKFDQHLIAETKVIDLKLLKSFTRQRESINEMGIENKFRIRNKIDLAQYDNILHHQRVLYRAICTLAYCCVTCQESAGLFQQLPESAMFKEVIAAQLDHLACGRFEKYDKAVLMTAAMALQDRLKCIAETSDTSRKMVEYSMALNVQRMATALMGIRDNQVSGD